MNFVLSNHAKERIIERELPNPEEVGLVLTKNNLKKRVREICKRNGFNTDLIYWRTNEKKPIIYVCKILDKAKYLVITAFRIE